MPMMGVREVRMLVRHQRVAVPMSVGLLALPSELVRMLVMLVMAMGVNVGDRFVGVNLFVMLRQVQPDTATHQRAGDP